MDRWQDRVAVVTGASSGIGAAVAKQLVESGVVVVGLARRMDRMEALRAELPEELHGRFHLMHCDVSDLDSITAAFDWVEEHLGGIDIMVNNAGCLFPGQLLTQDLQKLEQTWQVNIMGVLNCTRRAFRSMQQRDVPGHVVLINSLTGETIINPPGDELQVLNMYPLTKHGIKAMLEVLRQEFRGFKTKIKVTSITPGVTDTEILPRGYGDLPMLRPEDIAAGIMYALATPPHVQVHQLTIKPLGEPF
ncbi:farnesol dehydrogenase [Drosophila guanche]|uniref:Blast:Dehydrogenase/reductase SDR family member 11 n=1 Tax=Drosophila guanche TaxID=7266 RepID=A0A3B0JXY3_DROGU|nr:farnesol dehydrogenase [Drosophila guanche]SPP78619.1 blast:Dehydrogenase/reductase SDR family member 11 [Drosophila guanche]